ncbi:MAG TPA: aminopeptidase [Ignavibacteriales bacterium]|nr:aminopeptidase [Ignavibacteriales bacterium]
MGNKQEKMTDAALEALKYIFNATQNDKALILTDAYSQNIANAFLGALEQLKCTADTYLIEEKMRPLKEIPAELEKFLLEKTIVLNIIRAFPEEIPFRIKWLFKVEENNEVRTGHMPGITEDMMLNSVNVDFSRMSLNAKRLKIGLENAEQLHITTPEGTDISLGVKDRKFTSDIGTEETKTCNIPCGEIYCAPEETRAEGVVVFNASIGDIGMLKSPLRVFVHEGRITKFESDDNDLVRRIDLLSGVDEEAKVIGELGIGLNPGARITGNMLEDEKAMSTAHIAFGNNEDFPGGKNKSHIHRDYLFFRPTIEVKYKNGSKKLLVNEGGIIPLEFKTILDF